MKPALIFCLSLLLISGPKQTCPAVYPYLHLYWVKKAKKELRRAGQNPLLNSLYNSVRFVSCGRLGQLVLVLSN